MRSASSADSLPRRGSDVFRRQLGQRRSAAALRRRSVEATIVDRSSSVAAHDANAVRFAGRHHHRSDNTTASDDAAMEKRLAELAREAGERLRDSREGQRQRQTVASNVARAALVETNSSDEDEHISDASAVADDGVVCSPSTPSSSGSSREALRTTGGKTGGRSTTRVTKSSANESAACFVNRPDEFNPSEDSETVIASKRQARRLRDEDGYLASTFRRRRIVARCFFRWVFRRQQHQQREAMLLLRQQRQHDRERLANTAEIVSSATLDRPTLRNERSARHQSSSRQGADRHRGWYHDEAEANPRSQHDLTHDVPRRTAMTSPVIRTDAAPHVMITTIGRDRTSSQLVPLLAGASSSSGAAVVVPTTSASSAGARRQVNFATGWKNAERAASAALTKASVEQHRAHDSRSTSGGAPPPLIGPAGSSASPAFAAASRRRDAEDRSPATAATTRRLHLTGLSSIHDLRELDSVLPPDPMLLANSPRGGSGPSASGGRASADDNRRSRPTATAPAVAAAGSGHVPSVGARRPMDLRHDEFAVWATVSGTIPQPSTKRPARHDSATGSRQGTSAAASSGSVVSLPVQDATALQRRQRSREAHLAHRLSSQYETLRWQRRRGDPEGYCDNLLRMAAACHQLALDTAADAKSFFEARRDHPHHHHHRRSVDDTRGQIISGANRVVPTSLLTTMTMGTTTTGESRSATSAMPRHHRVRQEL